MNVSTTTTMMLMKLSVMYRRNRIDGPSVEKGGGMCRGDDGRENSERMAVVSE